MSNYASSAEPSFGGAPSASSATPPFGWANLPSRLRIRRRRDLHQVLLELHGRGRRIRLLFELRGRGRRLRLLEVVVAQAVGQEQVAVDVCVVGVAGRRSARRS